jgi:MFS transporter, DHA1 family, inner membrane transport protein
MQRLSPMPLQVWILTLAAFAIGTAEFVIAGILTQVSDSLDITEGQAGHLITAYALAIVIGGPILTLWLGRYGKREVLVGLMLLFMAANLMTATTENYTLLLVSRVLAGLTQGPFYGIGAVVATRLVTGERAGQAVGQMFAGLTLANVLGVPGGAYIGSLYGWQMPFMVVAGLALITAIAIALTIPRQAAEPVQSLGAQIGAFRDRNLLASLLITVLGWVGFMTFYGYVAPVAEQVAGFDRAALTWVLIIIGLGLVVGNTLGGKSADANLSRALIGWPAAMIVALVIVGLVAPFKWPFLVAAFAFGIVSFANVAPMQMRVMKYGKAAPELAATANISAFNIANAVGGLIGGTVVDSSFGPAAIPFVAAALPVIGLLFIANEERKARQPQNQPL